jgi:hypothetical protein
MEVTPDHVHMLVEAPPRYAPAKIVQIFKGISSRRLRQEFRLRSCSFPVTPGTGFMPEPARVPATNSLSLRSRL